MSAFISITGRLGRDPETRTTNTGKTVCSVSMAVTDGSQSEETLWVRLTAWERQAETLGRHKKADALAVVGRLALNVWQTKEGEERRDLVVTVDQIIGARPTPRVQPQGQSQPQRRQQGRVDPQAPTQGDVFDEELGDDIPF